MDLTSKKNIVSILERYNTQPVKGLGQNFLINKDVLLKIVSLVELKDIIVEVGPGIGVLTKEISKRSRKVIAIEKDIKMVEILKETLSNLDNIEIIHGDALLYKPKIADYKVISNLPYYISTAIIRNFLESGNPPKKMIVTVQKEVAQRICAKPPNMSILAVSVQLYAEPKILFNVARNSFWPTPNVDSSVLEINKKKSPKINQRVFFEIVKAGFSRPRAQLLNNISKKLKLEKEITKNWLLENNIQPERRAETLNIEEWISLTVNFFKIKQTSI